MAKGQATAQEVRKLSKVDGLHRVATGLYLRVRGGSSLWTFRSMVDGRASEYSLGSQSDLTLADAVAKVADLRAKVRRGEPVEVRPKVGAGKPQVETFASVALQLWGSMKPGWKNPKHADQWINTLRAYAFPHFGSKPVSEVGTDAVMAALSPIWQSKHETATRLRQRIEAVLSAAKARGLRTGENPAAWRDHLDALLPTISKKRRVKHFEAMDWRALPGFMAELRQRSSMSAWALQFTILTAMRTGTAIGARWSEIDLARGLWVIPGARMKTQVEHRVPLSQQAVAVLSTLPRQEGSDQVFWGARKPTISNMAMLELLRGMRPGLTVHGFRSSFSDWAAESTHFPAQVVEMALAHTIGNAVEAAYRRGDLFDKRRELMQAWADYLAEATEPAALEGPEA
jgi:integrase